MKKKLFALSGVFLIVLVVTGLWATRAISLTGVEQTINPTETSLAMGLSMRELTEGSSLIVMGNCLETRSQWIEGRRLVTVATVSVTEAIKGDPGAGTLRVVLPGGFDSNRRIPVGMTYAGAPQMSPTDEVFLFLIPQEEIENGYAVTGFAQGKFSIARDDEGQPVVTQDATKEPIQKGVGVTRGNPRAIPLPEFKEWVRSYLR